MTGVSLVEVLLAVSLLVVVLVPLLTSGTTMHRRTSHAEYRAVAAIRGRTLLDLVSTVDIAILRGLVRADPDLTGPVTVDLQALFEPGSVTVLLTPMVARDRMRAMLDRFQDVVTLEDRGQGLLAVTVAVAWKPPGSQDDRRRLTWSRLVGHPEASLAWGSR